MAGQPLHAVPLVAVLLLLAANILIPVSMAVFGKGFFPYKPLLPGLADYADLGYGDPAPAPFDRVVFMLVDALRSDFVFTANSGFEYTQALIRSGEALPFTAHATSPTVTMPRLKAITTGSTPSFLDVVLNVDEGDKSSSLASQDSWLAQLKARQKQKTDSSGKLVLCGDDTWLKLFPDMFDRADGTTSFFVSDFSEVDNNVTRHVSAELRQDDWSLLVLHYLGLDHIGHKGGPRSPHMVPKQREMDGIVRTIHESLVSGTAPHLDATMLVLIGDHGMNDAGNHGASSAGETSPALVFISPKLRELQSRDLYVPRRQSPLEEREDFQFYRTVEQSDLAPTLAALLGFPAPKNNLGMLISDFLPLWPHRRDQAHILLQNAHQLLGVLTAAFGEEPFVSAAGTEADVDCASRQTEIEQLGCEWQAIVRMAPGPESDHVDDDQWAEWTGHTIQWLRRAQDTMSGMASDYDMSKLGLGLASAVASFILAGLASWTLLSAASGGGDGSRVWSGVGSFASITTAYVIMMFASSYVEEEHHFWYWAATTWLAAWSLERYTSGTRSRQDASTGASTGAGTMVRVASAAGALLAALTAVRLVRAWNQTGQKYAGAPDVVKTFLQPSPLLLWTLIGATYVQIGWKMARGLRSLQQQPWLALPLPGLGQLASISALSVPALLVTAAVSFKLVFTLEDSPELVGSFARPLADLSRSLDLSLVTRARIVFAGLALVSLAAVLGILVAKKSKSSRTDIRPSGDLILSIYSLLAVTQSRAANIPLFLLFDVVLAVLRLPSLPGDTRRGFAPGELATTTLLLQYASFFALGGTNAISSVDLSSAYNGIAGFSASAVGVLTFVSNWSAPIYWAMAGVVLMQQQQKQAPIRSSSSGWLPWMRHVALLTVFAAGSTSAVMAACAVLRTHLFVWTVFSPKYLYCAAWSLGMHLGVNVVLGGLVYGLIQETRDERRETRSIRKTGRQEH